MQNQPPHLLLICFVGVVTLGQLAGCYDNPVGAVCARDLDCKMGLTCVRDEADEMGLCTASCEEEECPEGASCAVTSAGPVCLLECTVLDDCSAPSRCQRSLEGPNTCWFEDDLFENREEFELGYAITQPGSRGRSVELDAFARGEFQYIELNLTSYSPREPSLARMTLTLMSPPVNIRSNLDPYMRPCRVGSSHPRCVVDEFSCSCDTDFGRDGDGLALLYGREKARLLSAPIDVPESFIPDRVTVVVDLEFLDGETSSFEFDVPVTDEPREL